VAKLDRSGEVQVADGSADDSGVRGDGDFDHGYFPFAAESVAVGLWGWGLPLPFFLGRGDVEGGGAADKGGQAGTT